MNSVEMVNRLARLNLLQFIAASMLLLSANPNYSDEPYYTWVGKNGVVNYSQIKPLGEDAKLISEKEYRFGVRKVNKPKDKPDTPPFPKDSATERDRLIAKQRRQEAFDATMIEGSDREQVDSIATIEIKIANSYHLHNIIN